MRGWNQGALMGVMDKVVNKRLANGKVIRTGA